MDSISDTIENYIVQSLAQSPSNTIEIKRRQLACTFHCVPSQINYVISTRFTIEKGYLVESRRGGGGFIRIRKIKMSEEASFIDFLLAQIGNSIPQLAAEHVLTRIAEEKIITNRELFIIKRIISREVLGIPIVLRDEVRARIMKAIMESLFIDKYSAEESAE